MKRPPDPHAEGSPHARTSCGARNSPPTPHILQVSAFLPAHGGGIEVVAWELAKGLAERGCPVHWMAGGAREECPSRSPDGVSIQQAASIDPLERWIGLPMPLWNLRSLYALWRATGQADLIHIHDYLYQPSLAAALFASIRRKPWVLTQHIGEIPFHSPLPRVLLDGLNRSLGRLVLPRAHQVAFVGRPVQQYFEHRVPFRRAPVLIPNGVDHLRYHPAPRPPRAPDSPVELLFVGRFVEKKGMKALSSCLDLPGARFTFVGWGPMPPTETATSMIRLPGRLPADEVALCMQQADLLVLPSTGEGFPLVLQEALACGTPVLTSQEVAEAFPVLDPACVFAVELRGVDAGAALRKILMELLAHRERLFEGREAATRLAAQWSWEACVAACLELYHQALGEGRPQGCGSPPLPKVQSRCAR